MRQKNQALIRLIEILILPTIGLLIGIFYSEIQSRALSVALVAIFIILAVLYVFFEQYRYSRQLELDEQQLEVESQKKRMQQEGRELEERTRLLDSAHEGEMLSSASIKVTEVLREFNLKYPRLAQNPCSWNPSETGWVYNEKWEILKNICEVLKQDRKRFEGPNDYFKATLFRVKAINLLELDCSYYPPGTSPKTSIIERSAHPHATALRCLDTRAMQIIPNVREEEKKGDEAKWVELYPGQKNRYGSMMCTAVTIGEKANNTLEVVSILTIDTNRVDYFSNLGKDVNFLATLLAPFRQELSFIYLVERNTL